MSNIIRNIDACKAKKMDLWVPETSAEHHFVSQTFTGSTLNDREYHLGILRYDPKKGFYGVDHSFHVGNTYFSLSNELKSQNLDQLFTNGIDSCLVYNKITNTWKLKSPCENAIGVCKSRIGIEIPINISVSTILINYICQAT